MKILNIGSLNIDHVYQLDHFVQPGETTACGKYSKFCGGKGLNQSVALARAGSTVYHGGKIGTDCAFLKNYLVNQNIKTDFVYTSDEPTGHAIIQVNQEGENAIIIHGGANHDLSQSDIIKIIDNFDKNDLLLVQNETSNVATAIKHAKSKEMLVAFNPAPFTQEVLSYPLDLVDILIVNETEAQDITNKDNTAVALEVLKKQFSKTIIISTQGAKGVLYIHGKDELFVSAKQVKALDTTAAGDTFIGFFLASYVEDNDIKKSLEFGSQAAAVSVTKHGAADSIPTFKDLMNHSLEAKK